MSSDESGKVPTYIAQCSECQGLVACAVAKVDEPRMMRDASRYCLQWERAGLKVSTVTVADVRSWPNGLGHLPNCTKDKRKKVQPRDLFAEQV